MKITPLEIRQKSFEKKLRGYDKDEVDAFLLSLSQEWEQVQDEIKELKIKFQNAEKEIKQLREVENSLFKTLKTAEDTGANMIDQATKTADLHLRETQMNADALLNEAKSKARAAIEDSEMRARQIQDSMEVELKALSMEYRGLENLRDIIISELQNISNDTLLRVGKLANNAKNVDLSRKQEIVREGANSSRESPRPAPVIKEPTQEDALVIKDEESVEIREDEPQENHQEQEKVKSEGSPSADNDSDESSFFDKI
jgi:cell division initiation protein